MSLELTKLSKEIRIYKIVTGSVIDEYVIRTTYRDMSIPSYKWKLEVSFCQFIDFELDDFPVIFSAQNYTRDTLQRRFNEWRDSQGFILQLVEVRQFFLPKLDFGV